MRTSLENFVLLENRCRCEETKILVNGCEVYGKVTAQLDHDKIESFDAIFERVMRVVIRIVVYVYWPFFVVC